MIKGNSVRLLNTGLNYIRKHKDFRMLYTLRWTLVLNSPYLSGDQVAEVSTTSAPPELNWLRALACKNNISIPFTNWWYWNVATPVCDECDPQTLDIG